MDMTGIGNGSPRGGVTPSFGVRFGDMAGLNQCMGCQGMDRSGLFIIEGKYAHLLCVKCLATQIMRWQQTHPAEKLINVDVNVPDEAYPKMAKRLQELIPNVPDSVAVQACREILNECG